MKRPAFKKLVNEVDSFYYNQKVSALMTKTNARLQECTYSDFYSMLLEMLFEVHRSEPMLQSRILDKVLGWYQTNKHTLKTNALVLPQTRVDHPWGSLKQYSGITRHDDGNVTFKGSGGSARKSLSPETCIQKQTGFFKKGFSGSVAVTSAEELRLPNHFISKTTQSAPELGNRKVYELPRDKYKFMDTRSPSGYRSSNWFKAFGEKTEESPRTPIQLHTEHRRLKGSVNVNEILSMVKDVSLNMEKEKNRIQSR
ncbi:hypothetical protein HHUSO_G590 [Huso huso]|uniref:Uncharacterized protein n=1 Tax=Huso huso TaxID=61971 RepID=A0ABR1AAI5_HUSHU